MGSSVQSTKMGATKGSSLPKIGMATSKSGGVSAGNKGSATTTSSNMKK